MTTLLALHLRSRRAGWATLLIVISALLRRILTPWTTIPGPFTTLVSLLLIAAAATTITTSLASPFGEAERSAGGLLPALRLTHLTGTCLLAALAYTVAATTGGLSAAEYLRDLAGFTGIALLTGAVLGPHRCWTLPLAYAVLCAGEQDLQQSPLWAWPLLPSTNHSATLIASALLIVGASAGVWVELPDR